MVRTPQWSPKWDKGRQGTGRANEKKSVLNGRLRKKNDIVKEAYGTRQGGVPQ